MITPSPQPRILLITLNAKYIHSALGLRYLMANLGSMRSLARILEFTISRPAQEIVQDILKTVADTEGPLVLGFGVYIWNVRETEAVLHALRLQRPDIKIVLGGPEVSHELDTQSIFSCCDYVIQGWGDLSFSRLCDAILHGQPPSSRVISGIQPELAEITLPYQEYTDDDIAHRLIYVEASRGCPFKCAFCLSALDQTAWPFHLDHFLHEMDGLYERGARHFKFVDRTFNIKIAHSIRILEFFLAKMEHAAASGSPIFLHFEIIPDHLPPALQEVIARFPAGSLQFEVGIQSFNPAVQSIIARKQNMEKTRTHLHWLVQQASAHLHADLIFGLPGEDVASFASGFDQLWHIGVQEIQLGLLKRLRGSPLTRIASDYAMQFDPAPPYPLIESNTVSTTEVTQFARLARYWDLIANSGRFPRALELLMGCADSPYAAFSEFSAWLWDRTQKTHRLSPEALVDFLAEYLHGRMGLSDEQTREALLADYQGSGARSQPEYLRGHLVRRTGTSSSADSKSRRQQRHLSGTPETPQQKGP